MTVFIMMSREERENYVEQKVVRLGESFHKLEVLYYEHEQEISPVTKTAPIWKLF